MEITGLVSALVTGLVVGALGRLVVPGRQPLGCLFTILLGIVGAVLGKVAGDALDVGPLLVFVFQVLAAAVLVALVALPQRRR